MNDKILCLSSLDVFLLALIDSGVTTSYAMREQAGVSVGASRPSLLRLQKLGFVEKGEAESRNKTAFRLTWRGRQAKTVRLNSLLREFRMKPPSEPESIVRIASLAVFEGRVPGAVRVLSKAAEEFRRRAKDFDDAVKLPSSGIAGFYQSMMAACYAAHFHALAGKFSELALYPKKSLTKRPTPPLKSKTAK